jgi:hypothetical protein
VQNRLPVVDFSLGRNRDYHILVQKGWIIGRRFDVSTASKNFPWT